MKRRKGVLYSVAMVFACLYSLSCSPGKAQGEAIREYPEPSRELLPKPELTADTLEQLPDPGNDLWQPVQPVRPASTLVDPFEGDAKSNAGAQPS